MRERVKGIRVKAGAFKRGYTPGWIRGEQGERVMRERVKGIRIKAGAVKRGYTPGWIKGEQGGTCNAGKGERDKDKSRRG